MPAESHCINHPYVEATARCKRCNVPLCKDCQIFTPEGIFCSEKCATQMRIFVQRAKELEKGVRKPRARFPARQLIIAIGAILAVVLVLRFVFGVTSFADFRQLILTIVRTIRGG
jgi:hypothetical protein